MSSTKSRLIIAISFVVLEQSTVILSFVFEGQAGRVRCIMICINPAPTKMIDATEKPIRKRPARYNEFGYNACGYLVVFVVVVNFCY